MKNLKNISFLILVIVISLGTILPLFHFGFFGFHDNTQVVRVYEMGQALDDKIFPVRSVSGLGYGFGYPIFNFYAPLPYYIGGIIFNLSADPLFATKIMFGVGILFAAVSMFYFSKKFFGYKGGIVSAIIYSYFPYHAVNIYVRGAVDEFFAYAFLPLVFLGIYQLLTIKKNNLKILQNLPSIFAISFGIFLVATSHNLSFFMLLLLLFPATLVLLCVSKTKRLFLVYLLFSIAFGILLSSFYVIPAFLEMKYTNVLSQVGGGANFADHFVCINQYWNSMWGFGGSGSGCVDGLSFKLGKLNIILLFVVLVSVLYSLYKKKRDIAEQVTIVSIILFIISLFLTLSFSEFVWKSIPYMSFVQYPWRFINFMGLFLSFSVGYLMYFAKSHIKWNADILIGIIIIVLTVFTSFKLFVPQGFNSYPSSYYTQKEYIQFTVSKISDEYLPAGFDVPRSISEIPVSPVELLNTSGSIDNVTRRQNNLKASYRIAKDGVAHINIAYFPGWRAYLNEKSVPIVPTPRGMNVSIPYGEGIIELKFSQTPIEVLGNTLSVVAFFAVLAGIMFLTFNKKRL